MGYDLQRRGRHFWGKGLAHSWLKEGEMKSSVQKGGSFRGRHMEQEHPGLQDKLKGDNMS